MMPAPAPVPVLPPGPCRAARALLEFLIDSLWPLTLQMRSSLFSLDDTKADEWNSSNLKDVFSLCCSQIQKCVLHLLEIFRMEHQNGVSMQESRDSTMERLSWCLNRLHLVQKNIDQISQKTRDKTETTVNVDTNPSEVIKENIEDESLNVSALTTPMYFVNWIDHILELLTNLAIMVYRTDFKECNELYDTWKNEVMDCVTALHISVDELLMSAMTLCKYCLPPDQTVVTARCQVVLRETKMLINEIVEGNLDNTYKVTKDSLKLPLKPTNINVFVDVLKDAIYILESNTNTALLSLLIHCFSTALVPLKRLEEHFCGGHRSKCPCEGIQDTEDCLVVKDFDFYNERLVQMGGFSISCSSDENRILSLKSGLASLEALDPHLVPAIMMGSNPHHTKFLTNTWTQEVLEIKANIFLIVDPAAFSERTKQTMNGTLFQVMKQNKYVNADVCTVINIGELVYDFFTTYQTQEPEALVKRDQLDPMLEDLKKALKECKTVSNLSSTSAKDFLYDIPKLPQAKIITYEQVLKRLKLLYTLVNRINNLFHSSDEQDDDDDESDENVEINNATHTINKDEQSIKYTPRNATKNTFARSSKTNFGSGCIISKINRHLNTKKMQEQLSFSVQLDELFNDISQGNKSRMMVNKSNCINKTQNASVLYNFAAGSNRQSLRKVVLKKIYLNPSESNFVKTQLLPEQTSEGDAELDVSGCFMDSTSNLQITEILDQLSNFSKILNNESESTKKTIVHINTDSTFVLKSPSSNVLTITVNDHRQGKDVWNIPVNGTIDNNTMDISEPWDSPRNGTVDNNYSHVNARPCRSIDNTMDISRPSEFSVSSSTQSNITTFERLNDIDLLEEKLNQLKHSDV